MSTTQCPWCCAEVTSRGSENESRAKAIALMLAERTEQEVTHGHTVAKDRVYSNADYPFSSPLAAAAAYLLCQSIPSDVGSGRAPDCWPWLKQTFKPHPENRLKELTKAAALVLADMEQEILKQESSDENSLSEVR